MHIGRHDGVDRGPNGFCILQEVLNETADYCRSQDRGNLYHEQVRPWLLVTKFPWSGISRLELESSCSSDVNDAIEEITSQTLYVATHIHGP
jgi:hypothetical protein